MRFTWLSVRLPNSPIVEKDEYGISRWRCMCIFHKGWQDALEKACSTAHQEKAILHIRVMRLRSPSEKPTARKNLALEILIFRLTRIFMKLNFWDTYTHCKRVRKNKLFNHAHKNMCGCWVVVVVVRTFNPIIWGAKASRSLWIRGSLVIKTSFRTTRAVTQGNSFLTDKTRQNRTKTYDRYNC